MDHPGRLSAADARLSKRISPRARRPEDNKGLRTILVDRFSDTFKAVGRLGLRDGEVSIYCEVCDTWTPVEEFPLEFDCVCGRSYSTEFVVMAEVEPESDQPATPNEALKGASAQAREIVVRDRRTRMSPDPNAEYWTVDDVAEYVGLAHLTIIQYHQQRKMPYRDKRSSTLLWRPERIMAWRPRATFHREWRREGDSWREVRVQHPEVLKD